MELKSKKEQTTEDELARKKKLVEEAYIWFSPNYKRFNKFQKFCWDTTISQEDEDSNRAMGKPIIEFNMNPMYLCRQIGEFYMHQPSVDISPAIGSILDDQKLQVMKIIGDHLRYIVDECTNRLVPYRIYKDEVSGGWGNMCIRVKYREGMTFDQVAYIDTQYDPVLVGYDPLAQETNKSDAKYYFELYPWLKEDLEKKYDITLDDNNSSFNVPGFVWFDSTGKTDTVLVCDFYEIKTKYVEIVKISAKDKYGRYIVMKKEDYKQKVKELEESGTVVAPPEIVGDSRKIEITSVEKSTMIGNQFLSEKESTIFKRCPSLFADGNSTAIKDESGANYKQFTIPYMYHSAGMQRLKNLAGQTWAGDIEDMVMHKFMAAIESLPPPNSIWLKAWTMPQRASVLAYQAFDRNDPSKPLPPPSPVVRVPLPDNIPAAFNNADQTIQTLQGTFDTSLGDPDNTTSGKAIVEGATQSNPVARPYMVGYIQALNGTLQHLVQIFPELYADARSIPTLGIDGQRQDIMINTAEGIKFDYDHNDFQVSVKAGVNSTIAKNQAMRQIVQLMSVSENIKQFIEDEGIEVILDNLEFRGSDMLKDKLPAWLKNQQKMKQKMMANMPNPEKTKVEIAQMDKQTEEEKLAQQERESQREFAIDTAEIDIKKAELLAGMHESHQANKVQMTKAATEKFGKEVELHLAHSNQLHAHARDFVDSTHNIIKENNANEREKEKIERDSKPKQEN